MSPEQARGGPVDHRSDIFSLGVILYELVTGRRAFDRRSRAETMNAIINEEPVLPTELNPSISHGLERTMLHSLEKNPDDRFQTASDLCFALGEVTMGSGGRAAIPALPQRQGRWHRYAMSGAVAVALLAVGFGANHALRYGRESLSVPTVRQISYRRGYIPYQCARFAPDGETIIYSAAWDGDSTDLYLGRTDNFESRPLGFPAGRLCSVSKSGEIALIFNRGNVFGTLARVAMTGTSPRELVDGSMHADWTPDGKSLAAVLATSERLRVECPLGTVIYTLPRETRALNAIRVSPRGDRIALIEGRSATWILFLVDMAGQRTDLTSRNLNGQGIAWSPDGSEVYFTRSEAGKTVVSGDDTRGRRASRGIVPGRFQARRCVARRWEAPNDSHESAHGHFVQSRRERRTRPDVARVVGSGWRVQRRDERPVRRTGIPWWTGGVGLLPEGWQARCPAG